MRKMELRNGLTVGTMIIIAAMTGCEKRDDAMLEQRVENAGQEIKESAQNAGQEIRETAQNAGQQIREGAQAAGQEVREAANNTAEATREAANDTAEAARRAANNTSEAVREGTNNVREGVNEVEGAAARAGNRVENAVDRASIQMDQAQRQAERVAANSPREATDQQENRTDLALTASIRRTIIADSSLSMEAKNVTIVTRNSVVTLEGAVKNARERTTISRAATNTGGVSRVENRLIVPTAAAAR